MNIDGLAEKLQCFHVVFFNKSVHFQDNDDFSIWDGYRKNF